MALAVEQNVSVDPRDVGGFRATAVMAQASRGASVIEQPRLGRFRRISLVNRAGEAVGTIVDDHGRGWTFAISIRGAASD
jgi:hypothetical protein